MSSPKIRVALAYGGKSGEHEISILSASSIAEAIDKDRYELTPIGISKAGELFKTDSVTLDMAQEQAIDLSELSNYDVVFPALHGPLYEDGVFQGALETIEVPYVGSGVLASAAAMDKDIAKRLILLAGIKTADYVAIGAGAWAVDRATCLDDVKNKLNFPLFVKPACLGSSVATYKVATVAELTDAISSGLEYDTKVLIEQAIDGREVEVGVLENLAFGHAPITSLPGEIIIDEKYEFYSYEAKYLDPNCLKLNVPAELSDAQATQLREVAGHAFSLLGCEGLARADFFMDRTSGEIYFNELNTLPGFTSMSMYPMLLGSAGIAYPDLISHLIDLALAKHERKQAIKRELG